MTTYRHPNGVTRKTWDAPILIAFTTRKSPIVYQVKYTGADQLLALWFEEVKEEEKQDWIDSAIKEMEQYFTYNETGVCLTSMPPKYPRYNKTDLRKVLEKHLSPFLQ